MSIALWCNHFGHIERTDSIFLQQILYVENVNDILHNRLALFTNTNSHQMFGVKLIYQNRGMGSDEYLILPMLCGVFNGFCKNT